MRGPLTLDLTFGTDIDTFDVTTQVVVASTSPGNSNPDFDSAASPEAVGGSRDLFVELTSPTGRVEILVNDTSPGIVEFGALGTSTGTRVITWDGPDGDATTLDPTGLGGVDLTEGSLRQAVHFRIGADQDNGQAFIRVYTDANRYSTATLVVPNTGGGADEVVLMSFADDFVASGTLGGADFTNVGAIQFEVEGASNRCPIGHPLAGRSHTGHRQFRQPAPAAPKSTSKKPPTVRTRMRRPGPTWRPAAPSLGPTW